MPGSKKNLEQIFQQEIDLLKLSKNDLSNPQYLSNELLPKYHNLLREYEKLLKLSRKIFVISDSQGRALKRREHEIENLLANINQGFLTFGQDLLVDSEYSTECSKIFGKRIANDNIIELLNFPDHQQRQHFLALLTTIFNTAEAATRNQCMTQLPNSILINEKSIELAYKFIQEAGRDEKQILLILTDITDQLQSKAQIEYLSYYDSLTGLFNRAYVDKTIPEIMCPNNLPLSIILGDMNGLKLINDVFGHKKGDELIINAAKVLQKCCRRTDVVARWGGDEFLILLPNTNSALCQKVVDRITKVCQETPCSPIEISLALGSATLEQPSTDFSEVFSGAENHMYKKKLLESKATRQRIISDVERRLQTSCFATDGHVYRIKKLAVHLAELLGFSTTSTEMKNLQLLASLHDVGNLALPQEILCKPDSLTPEEWKIIKSHSEIGYRMGLSIGEATVAEAILAMHEHWDGSGYPSGLKGEQIPLITRLLAIIDTYDVMTHDRIFQRAASREQALAEIRLQSGKQFDPSLVKIFLEQSDILLPPDK